MVLLDIVERLGLTLLVTAGFAAGLSLYNGMPLVSPALVQACAAMFFWALALIWCVTSRPS